MGTEGFVNITDGAHTEHWVSAEWLHAKLKDTQSDLATAKAEIERLERNCDSLRLERDGLEHVRLRDNQHLLDRAESAEASLQTAREEREREIRMRDWMLTNVKNLAEGRVLSEHPDEPFSAEHRLAMIRSALDGGRIMEEAESTERELQTARERIEALGRMGDRFYLLLALFDTRNGKGTADFVRSAREGWERSDPKMGPAENEDAWTEFDRLWNRYTSEERLNLTRSVIVDRGRMATILRDWLHETPMSRCSASSETCETWDLAYELVDMLIANTEIDGKD